MRSYQPFAALLSLSTVASAAYKESVASEKLQAEIKTEK